MSNKDKFLNPNGAYVTLQYKQDVGKPEEGNYAPLFSTSFDKYPDLSGATISYWGPTGLLSPTAPMFLLAKGANSDPYPAYFFDISSWNRIDRIDLSSFWVDRTGEAFHILPFIQRPTVDNSDAARNGTRSPTAKISSSLSELNADPSSSLASHSLHVGRTYSRLQKSFSYNKLRTNG